MKNYYKILEVESTATLEQIKTQHRFLLHAWHPDKFPKGELRDKADEKIRSINEAYSILSNPAKREKYDKAFRLSLNPLPQSAQPVKHPPNESSKEYCESCGLSAETKYVEFHENIGMILMRQHHSVKGKFCKSCIDYYFWNLTGKTMLLGWWGIISFIVTPFILLNNLLRFIFSMNMKKPRLYITPSPSPLWIFTAVCGFLLIALNLLFSITSISAQSSYTPPPTAKTAPTFPSTKDVTPTRIPTKAKTSTPTSNCIQWSKVSASMIGKYACVYGKVHKTQTVGQSTFQILFSNNPSAFFLAAGTYYYEVTTGDCVLAKGEVLKSGAGVPYIDINEKLYNCESWMK
jgi:hypothetical protein